jgi:branched-chain amino acid transport system permease protein
VTAESVSTVGGATTSSTWLPTWFEAWFPVLLLAVVGGSLPLWGDSFFGIIATRVCVYWVLVSGLNLVVGFAGQLAIGWVSLLTIGAYVASALAAGRVTPEIPAMFHSSSLPYSARYSDLLPVCLRCDCGLSTSL